MKTRSEPRKPSLATIVGSSLAVAAAGSLLAFSSLAEQAGLQGLAVGGIQPARPGTVGTEDGKPITIPAPSTAPPRDPRAELEELVRDALARDREPAAAPRTTISFERAPRRTPAERRAPVPVARVAVAGRPVAEGGVEWDGPPYGHAYGHYKGKHDAKKKHAPKPHGKGQPVYARSGAEPEAAPKPPKVKKAKKVAKAEATGHAKHAHGKSKGKAKGKGHAKHGG